MRFFLNRCGCWGSLKRSRSKLLTPLLACFLLLSFHQSFSQPIRVDPSKRYLLWNGEPYFMVGDAAWSLVGQLSDADADLYLKNRHEMGFNTVLVNLIEHLFATNAPNNIYNQSPFTGAAFSSAPNEQYFAHVDYIINSAAQQGIVVMLDAVYLGYGCSSQGWCVEVQSADTNAMRSWGAYIGKRYAGSPNIIWVIGGDTNPGSVKTKLRAVVDGIRQFDTTHLFTAHNAPEQMAVDPWPGETWLDVNSVYTYSSTLYDNCASAYALSPAKPFYLIESAYENEGASQQRLRSESYYAVLSGACGHVFGNCPIWHFDGSPSWCAVSNWKGQLLGQGSFNMKYFHDLFTSRRWYKLIPDTTHKAVTAGYGTYGGSDYVTAAYCSDSSSIIAYLPSSRAVTVDMSLVSGSAAAVWWFNPSDGTYTRAGTYAQASQPFTPPGGGDWVLVVDNVDLYPDTKNPPFSDIRQVAAPATADVGVWPNPFKTTLTIPTQNSSIVEVFDILGRRVFSGSVSPGQSTFTWTPRNVGYGVYFVKVGTSLKTYKVLYAP